MNKLAILKRVGASLYCFG